VQFPPGVRLNGKNLKTALKEIGRTLTDVFLVAVDSAGTEWQFVYPTQHGGREVLRRMVVVKGQPRRTVVEQLAGIYKDTERLGIRRAIDNAYDVEKVTRKFFTEYRRVFNEVMTLVTGLPDDEERRLFCQTLMNRLMFLYFLQRKGWLVYNATPTTSTLSGVATRRRPSPSATATSTGRASRCCSSPRSPTSDPRTWNCATTPMD